MLKKFIKAFPFWPLTFKIHIYFIYYFNIKLNIKVLFNSILCGFVLPVKCAFQSFSKDWAIWLLTFTTFAGWSSMEIRNKTLCALGLSRISLQIVKIVSLMNVCEPQFLHLPILRKALQSLAKISVLHAEQQLSTEMCA